MKTFILVLVFILSGYFSIAQDQKKQSEKLKSIEKLKQPERPIRGDSPVGGSIIQHNQSKKAAIGVESGDQIPEKAIGGEGGGTIPPRPKPKPKL